MGNQEIPSRRVLFLCSGNYYRSRFAEHLFNWLADQERMAWRAVSRGIVVGLTGNIGPISRHCLDGLKARGVPVHGDARFPRQVSEQDLEQADLIVALKESEHRPMMTRLYPACADRVEYWHIHDLDCARPQEALEELEAALRSLIARLKDRDSRQAA